MKKEIDIRMTLRRAIVKSGMTIPQIAEKANINRTALYNYLKGKTEMGAKNLEKVMNVVGITLDF